MAHRQRGQHQGAESARDPLRDVPETSRCDAPMGVALRRLCPPLSLVVALARSLDR
jgi:hypothetical protein